MFLYIYISFAISLLLYILGLCFGVICSFRISDLWIFYKAFFAINSAVKHDYCKYQCNNVSKQLDSGALSSQESWVWSECNLTSVFGGRRGFRSHRGSHKHPVSPAEGLVDQRDPLRTPSPEDHRLDGDALRRLPLRVDDGTLSGRRAEAWVWMSAGFSWRDTWRDNS